MGLAQGNAGVSQWRWLLLARRLEATIALWDLQSGQSLRTLRRDRPYERLNITGIRGLTEAQKASLRVLGAREDADGSSL
jgi:hypothetical protein